MEEYVYVLREDMYNEWSWENGATDIICLSKNYKTIMNYVNDELDIQRGHDRIIEQYKDNISLEEQIKGLADNNDSGVYIDIYENEEDYSNGKNMATLVVSYEKVEK